MTPAFIVGRNLSVRAMVGAIFTGSMGHDRAARTGGWHMLALAILCAVLAGLSIAWFTDCVELDSDWSAVALGAAIVFFVAAIASMGWK